MGVSGLFLIFILLAVIVAVLREWTGPDVALFGALVASCALGIVGVEEAFLGFSNPALLTIGSLFVVAAALKETGALHALSNALFGRAQTVRLGLVRLLIPTALMSAVVNNTPVVAMLIPPARSFAKRIGDAPSRFLMPLGFAAMLGGTCTVIGTSANLVVSGQLERAGLPPLGMVELAWVGIPTVIVGIGYLLTVGDRLLNWSTEPGPVRDVGSLGEYLAEVRVAPESPIVGKTIEGGGLRHLPGLFVAELHRADGTHIRPVRPTDRLRSDDTLVLSGVASSVADLQTIPGLEPVDGGGEASDARHLFEVVVSHRGRLAGNSVREVGFRRRYDAAVLAVHRAGERVDGRIGDIVLRAGDALMLTANPGFRETWRDSADFYLVSATSDSTAPRYTKAPIAWAVLAAVVLVPALSQLLRLWYPSLPSVQIPVVAAAGVVVLILGGCVTARQARQSIDLSILIVIGSALGLSEAVAATGLVDAALQWLSAGGIAVPPILALTLAYCATVAVAMVLSNAAAAALMIPVAFGLATACEVDPRPFAVMVALAASAGFASPVGSNATLLTMGPGGYRFRDYFRVGLPLNALCFVVALIVVPIIWPL